MYWYIISLFIIHNISLICLICTTTTLTANPLSLVICEQRPPWFCFFVLCFPQLLHWIRIWGGWWPSQHPRAICVPYLFDAVKKNPFELGNTASINELLGLQHWLVIDPPHTLVHLGATCLCHLSTVWPHSLHTNTGQSILIALKLLHYGNMHHLLTLFKERLCQGTVLRTHNNYSQNAGIIKVLI